MLYLLGLPQSHYIQTEEKHRRQNKGKILSPNGPVYGGKITLTNYFLYRRCKIHMRSYK